MIEHQHCRHLWEPRADGVRIWQVCVKCGKDEHVVTHEQALRDTLQYIFRDV